MIEAKELRIGNLIENEVLGKVTISAIMSDTICVIRTIHMNLDRSIEDRFIQMSLSSVSGIPLTSEILEACGFKKWDKNEQSGITRYTRTHSISKDFLIYLYGDGKIEFCIDCDEFSKVLNEVYSLHQLQNLYFSLTGKELTYSPNTQTESK